MLISFRKNLQHYVFHCGNILFIYQTNLLYEKTIYPKRSLICGDFHLGSINQHGLIPPLHFSSRKSCIFSILCSCYHTKSKQQNIYCNINHNRASNFPFHFFFQIIFMKNSVNFLIRLLLYLLLDILILLIST